jgi:DNA-binding NtrC family response regulator
VFRLVVPPLRERPEDLPALVQGLLQRICAEQGRRDVPGLSAEGLARLQAYRFPGNVRELRNILERATVLEDGPLGFAWLSGAPAVASASANQFSESGVKSLELERRYARWALERLGGRRLETAKALGISHPTFNKLVREEP